MSRPFQAEEPFEHFFTGYLTAAKWSTSGVDNQGNEVESLEAFEWAPGTEEKLRENALAFFIQHGALLEQYAALRQHTGNVLEFIGHDFWLDRNGHGCGFWDRDCGEVGNTLTELVGWGTEYPEVDLYLGDDNLIYVG